jgi:nitrite reductase (NADH) small subunit
MAKAISLGPLSQIPTGEGRTFKIGDTRVAVFRTHKDMVYATQAECPHRMGPLADGMLGGTTLVCPLHDWMFDLTTGESLNGTCGIKTYATHIGPDGNIVVEIEPGGQTRATGDLATGAPSPG